MNEFLEFSFGAIDRWIYAPIFILVVWAIINNHRRIAALVKQLVHPLHQKNLFKNFSSMRHLIKTIALVGAVVALFIALLQPQWNKKDQTITQEGRDLIIALDISRSMLVQDIKPNRLENMKLKVRTLLQKLKFERVGLVLFSGSAFVQCPLTVDYATFLMFLDQVDVETIASGTTAIDTALAQIVDLYAHYPGRKNKLALLITDGEDFSTNLEAVRNQAKEEGIKVFTLGAATLEGGPIPILDTEGKPSGHEVDEKGGIVLSKLNEPLLQEMSEKLGGHYMRARYDDSDLDYIVGMINKFEKEKFDDKKLSLYEDQYPWFLGFAWICLALQWIL